MKEELHEVGGTIEPERPEPSEQLDDTLEDLLETINTLGEEAKRTGKIYESLSNDSEGLQKKALLLKRLDEIDEQIKSYVDEMRKVIEQSDPSQEF